MLKRFRQITLLPLVQRAWVEILFKFYAIWRLNENYYLRITKHTLLKKELKKCDFHLYFWNI